MKAWAPLTRGQLTLPHKEAVRGTEAAASPRNGGRGATTYLAGRSGQVFSKRESHASKASGGQRQETLEPGEWDGPPGVALRFRWEPGSETVSEEEGQRAGKTERRG